MRKVSFPRTKTRTASSEIEPRASNLSLEQTKGSTQSYPNPPKNLKLINENLREAKRQVKKILPINLILADCALIKSYFPPETAVNNRQVRSFSSTVEEILQRIQLIGYKQIK